MKRKTAYLIINPQLGKNVSKLTDMIAIFSAAGWKIDTALKEFPGHTAQLAREAAEAGYDFVIGHGGDGTLNQVINGVMAAKRRRSIVGVIPGGTANVWAHEIGMSEDPVRASLLLINSEGRKVDLGHVEINSPSLPPRAKDSLRNRSTPGGRHHFLLMAGLGLDAAVLSQVSTSLKERIGEAAVALAAVKELPFQHAFPIEIRSSGAGGSEGVLWRGEALQVIVGNTRRYGNFAEVTPDAYINDGVLDVCIITEGAPLTTIEQILSILLHREPVPGRSEYFQGAHFWISVPSSVDLQLDGSRVKRKDCLAAQDKAFLEHSGNPETDLVTYRFDALPRALRMAIPCTYDDTLFQKGSEDDKTLTIEQDNDQNAVREEARAPEEALHLGAYQIAALLEHGRKVTVVGAGPDPGRAGTWIVAGGTIEEKTGEFKPVAVRIDGNTTLIRQTGEPLLSAFPAALSEGGLIFVDGKKSKRGVIRAKRVVVMT